MVLKLRILRGCESEVACFRFGNAAGTTGIVKTLNPHKVRVEFTLNVCAKGYGLVVRRRRVIHITSPCMSFSLSFLLPLLIIASN